MCLQLRFLLCTRALMAMLHVQRCTATHVVVFSSMVLFGQTNIPRLKWCPAAKMYGTCGETSVAFVPEPSTVLDNSTLLERRRTTASVRMGGLLCMSGLKPKHPLFSADEERIHCSLQMRRLRSYCTCMSLICFEGCNISRIVS